MNGIKWNGKCYHENNIIRIFNQGKGFKKEKFLEISSYEGEFFDENLLGIGKIEIFYDGSIYEGEFKMSIFDNPSKEGYGRLYDKNEIQYEGEFKSNKFDGIGIYYYKNGNRYEGEFKSDKFDGIGIYYYKDGDRYEGEFKDDKGEGKGIFYYNNGDKYDGY